MSDPVSDLPEGDVTLEVRLERLEQILTRMEAEDVELAEALQLFEEGVSHVREAERVLSETELRVEELLSGDQTKPLADSEG